MKIKGVILLGIISLFCGNPSSVKAGDVNDIIIDTISPSRLNLKGKVKLFKEFIHFAVDKNGVLQSGVMAKDSDFVIKSDYKTNKCYIFDINGFNIQTNEYWSPTEVRSLQKNTFQNKKLTQSNTEYRFSDGIRHSKSVYNYNEKGLISSYLLYNIYGKLSSKRLYRYDDHNNIVWEREVDGDGEIDHTTTTEYRYEGDKMIYSKENADYVTIHKWQYDSSNREISSYYQWDNLVWDSSYELNNEGKKVKISCKGAKGEIKYITTFKYNDNGDLIEKKEMFSNGRQKTYTYDIAKKTYPITTTIDEILAKKEVYVDNNLMEYYDGKNTYEYRYTYDSKGNWIKAIEEKNSIPTYIKVRTIQYFP